ncbi:DMT family transporter [Kiloniella sp. b19]|uniref:DMT family transporter n=1 Tax=Kiloniella sp. GXU_MW_B19 TaxID=3141326 RepID=UPI0031DEB663
MSSTTKGILFSLLGTAFFTPVFAAGKIADGLYPAIALMLARYAGGLLTVLGVIAITGMPLASLRSAKPQHHFFRALLGAGGGICAIHAATSIPVAYATSIGLTEGLLVIILAGLILGEEITRHHWIACALAGAGALIVTLQSLDSSTLSLSLAGSGAFAALAGAVFIALESLYIKFLAEREKPLGMLLFVNGFGTVLLLCAALWMLDPATLLSPDYLIFGMLGVLAITGQYFNILSYQNAAASVLAPIHYSWIVFASLLGFVAFDEIPTLWACLGIILILCGGLTIQQTQKKRNLP